MRRIQTSDLLEVALGFVVVKVVERLDATLAQRFEARALRFAQPSGRLLSLHEKCGREHDDKYANKVVQYISSKDLLNKIARSTTKRLEVFHARPCIEKHYALACFDFSTINQPSQGWQTRCTFRRAKHAFSGANLASSCN